MITAGQRTAAKVAGVAYLATFLVVVVANFAIHEKLNVAGSVVSYAWCAFCAAAFIIFPSFEHVVNLWFFDTPMALFEIFTSVWLLTKGLNDVK